MLLKYTSFAEDTLQAERLYLNATNYSVIVEEFDRHSHEVH